MWIWVVAAIVVLLVAWNALSTTGRTKTIRPLLAHINPIRTPSTHIANPFGSPPPGGTYYENPAAGDDGSYNCPPGGRPVYVGSIDPAGLDGDGDGIGCE